MATCRLSGLWSWSLSVMDQAIHDGLEPRGTPFGNEFFNLATSLKASRHLRTYSAALSACEKGARWRLAQEIFERMADWRPELHRRSESIERSEAYPTPCGSAQQLQPAHRGMSRRQRLARLLAPSSADDPRRAASRRHCGLLLHL